MFLIGLLIFCSWRAIIVMEISISELLIFFRAHISDAISKSRVEAAVICTVWPPAASEQE